MSDRYNERGFSLAELLMVVTIIAMIVAIAVPQLLSVIYGWKINGTASSLAGLIQQGRILAEKQNTTIPVYTGTVETNAQGGFLGTTGSTWASGEPDVPFAPGVSTGSASNVPSALSPGFTPEAAGTVLYFNGRGLPVKASGASFVSSNGVIFYLTDLHGNWAAVSVTGTGRSKAWRYSGSWH